jgi:peptidoglycan/xylan/chitin deacetylase (PgdA/CDA1 family)
MPSSQTLTSLNATLRRRRARRHGIVYAAPGPVRRREVALTFDDGPSTEWTPQILDLLRDHGACATFFVLGASIAGCEAVLERMAAEGHEVANHAFSHRDPASLDDDALRGELERTSELLERVVGRRPHHFRPPYAETDHRVADLARAAGFDRTVLRSVDPADWNQRDSDRIAADVLGGVRRGSIVCLHDALPPDEPRGTPTRQPTVDALQVIVPRLIGRGFRLVTVTELLAWRRR